MNIMLTNLRSYLIKLSLAFTKLFNLFDENWWPNIWHVILILIIFFYYIRNV